MYARIPGRPDEVLSMNHWSTYILVACACPRSIHIFRRLRPRSHRATWMTLIHRRRCFPSAAYVYITVTERAPRSRRTAPRHARCCVLPFLWVYNCCARARTFAPSRMDLYFPRPPVLARVAMRQMSIEHLSPGRLLPSAFCCYTYKRHQRTEALTHASTGRAAASVRPIDSFV